MLCYSTGMSPTNVFDPSKHCFINSYSSTTYNLGIEKTTNPCRQRVRRVSQMWSAWTWIFTLNLWWLQTWEARCVWL